MRKFPGEKVENPDAERQKRKIVAYFLTRNDKVINENDASIAPWHGQEVLRQMRCNEIDKDDKKKFLRRIATPADVEEIGEEGVLKDLDDKELKILWDEFHDKKEEKKGLPEPEDIRRFLNKYKTPFDFKKDEDKFLKSVATRQKDKPFNMEVYEKYRLAMESFKSKIYGKRYEYYERLEEMDCDARGYELRALSAEEKIDILDEAKMEGDAVGKRGILSVENLEYLGLAPTVEMNFENASVAFSPMFKVGSREAVIGYVKTSGSNETIVRSYYRSNSQGLWRYLPDYVMDYDSGKIKYYGKTNNEERVSVPMVMQDALAKAFDGTEPMDFGWIDPYDDFAQDVLMGTAKRYGEPGMSYDDAYKEYGRCQREGTAKGAFYEEVDSIPEVNFGIISREKPSPESLDIKGGKAPDFSDKKRGFETDGGMYGRISVETFESMDGSMEYTVCTQKSSGKCWIGGAETKGKITSTGCRKSFVSLGHLATPPYDYDTQDGGYGDRSDQLHGYVGMWANYVSRMPVIQKYLHRHDTIESFDVE